MDKNKIIYWIATGLFSVMLLMGAGMYFFDNEHVTEEFVRLGYPTYLIYFLATAKVLGVATITIVKNKSLKEWAYSAFFFELLLAFGAHINAQDGEYYGALAAIVLLLTSYLFAKKSKIV